MHGIVLAGGGIDSPIPGRTGAKRRTPRPGSCPLHKAKYLLFRTLGPEGCYVPSRRAGQGVSRHLPLKGKTHTACSTEGLLPALTPET